MFNIIIKLTSRKSWPTHLSKDLINKIKILDQYINVNKKKYKIIDLLLNNFKKVKANFQ